ncbi:MAG: chromosome segregation protein SMC [Pirellulaceae bacterium]
MLKALELHGFKSFADRARFEFPAGITVIVGPNGSGKSNIVDGIKWVLGEQSAKSLRGKEMADCIFKGSGQSGRKPMNAAEATLVFDNVDRLLPIDAPEVHITRRVFRSGEGEYLINRQPARLKDIRDLFRGTGVGGDAYSLIEQGKVDRLLQASAKDRRAMFEEAAGISRFKAKKVEAQRRLERVDQNLLRLSDIVEEVENRLKTVRAQAGKARRYRETSERLQALRTQIARVDWQQLGEKLAGIEGELVALVQQIDAADAQAQQWETAQLEREAAIATAAEEVRHCESRFAGVRQQLSQQASTIAHERKRSSELDEERQLHRRNLLAMSDRAGDVRSRLQATASEVSAAHEAQSTAAAELARRESQLAELAHHHQGVRGESEGRRKAYVARLQSAAALASQVEAGETQLAAVQQAMLEHENQLASLTAGEQQAAEALLVAQERERQGTEQLAAHSRGCESAQNELTENRNLHASRADDLAQLHTRRQGVVERHDVLEEFERTLEGIGTGVKQLLSRAGIRGTDVVAPSAASYPWSLVRGVIADFVQVGLEHAAAIDAALGDAAQSVVAEGNDEQVQQLLAACEDLTGRVVVQGAVGPESQSIELTAEMAEGLQLVARADKLVQCEDERRPLVRLLLGSTFVLRRLEDAVQLRQRAPHAARCVTLDGELIDEHGAIHFGPRQSATSLVSRRSQLRAARLDLAVLDQQIADAHRETQHLKRETQRHELAVRQLAETGKSLDLQAAAERLAVQSLGQQADQARRQKSAAGAALGVAGQQCQTIQSTLNGASRDLAEAQADAEQMQAAIAEQEQELAALDASRQQATDDATAAKVELARCQQRLESLRLRLTQFEDDRRERERALDQVRDQLRQAQQRLETSQVALLAASAQIAELALQHERLGEQMRELAATRNRTQAERGQIVEQLTALRRRALKLRDGEHQLELSAEQVRHERRTLADRLREDYGIELAELIQEPTAEQAQERAAAVEEIELLRRKINQIGAVNLDALDELDDLEQRFGTLASQHKDLTDAKLALDRIIHKINADSRRLFLETLEAIRVNFQALYRKAFGGGKADIVLEEGVDVLECGVEIIATPPGKPSFNNSLLSGGEKALTAVALLLAIFQFRPSPFCVLDEVDAPFDEANIGRFIDVLKDFLGWTRFVIVTHSKKTMTAATTLYGVTMQESGVSKRVSVRFDDVSDDGQIRREALDHLGDDGSANQRGVA